MKFFALVALLGTAASIKLTQHTPKMHNNLAKRHVQSFMKTRWDDLTDEQVAEIEAWVEMELSTGEKTITKEEAHAAIKAFGKKHGFEPLSKKDWDELEAWFDVVDTNDDGALDLDELMAGLEE